MIFCIVLIDGFKITNMQFTVLINYTDLGDIVSQLGFLNLNAGKCVCDLCTVIQLLYTQSASSYASG